MQKTIGFNKVFVKKNLKIIIPIILSQMLFVAVGFVDNFMITKYDEAQNHLVAVGNAAEIWFAFSAFYMAMGALFGTLYAQFYANPDKSNFKQTFKVNIHFVLALTLVTSLIMYFMAPILMSPFFTKDAVINQVALDLSIDYIRIIALGNIFVSLSTLFVTPLVMMGKAKYVLIITLISLFTNIIFDYIFIYTLDQGAPGAAWSTTLSYFIQLGVSIYLFIRNKDVFKGMGNIFKLDKKILKLTFARSWMVISISALNISLAGTSILWTAMYGSEIMKSLSIAYAISGIMFTIFPAAGQATKIVVGQYLGASEFDNAKAAAKYQLWLIMGCAAVLSLVGLIISFVLPNALINDSKYANYSAWVIRGFCVAMFGYLITAYFMGVIETSGATVVPAIMNYFSQIWLAIPVAIIAGAWVCGVPFVETFWISSCSIYAIGPISYLIYKQNKWLKNLNEHKTLN